MDIEDLSTTQIILLALLVSFVTSIATGIVTVSLLAQAPASVTNTVNQIVERTVETVLPATDSKPSVTIKETTVVVKEEDLITKSISESFAKTARVYGGVATSSSIVGLAAVTSLGVISDSSVVDGDHLITVGGVSAVYSVQAEYPEIGVALLVPKDTKESLKGGFMVGATDSLKLGQTAIGLLSVTNERVQIGAVSSRTPLVDVTKKDKTVVGVRTIDTNIAGTLVPGTPLVNIFGDFIGISTYMTPAGSFVSASDIALLFTAPAATSTPAR
ncbi:hypothetical protein K2P56_02130 [Patescibacteria group bacterium]|nr:hypothetical protein [Patescibacteria group bacterium]